MQALAIAHLSSGATMDRFYHCANGCAVYEAHAIWQHREWSGTHIRVMQCATADAAVEQAKE